MTDMRNTAEADGDRSPLRSATGVLAINLFVIAFGMGICVAARDISSPVVVDPIGPSVWPILLGAGIALLATIDIAWALFRGAEKPKAIDLPQIEAADADESEHFSPWRLGTVLLLLFLYITGLEVLGYYVSTPLFVLFLLLMLGVRSWKGLATPTILLVLLWGAAFQWGLGVPLPKGFIFSFLN